MKIHRYSFVPVVSFCVVFMLSSCEHDITIESDVHPDGSLNRTIVLHHSDSAAINRNIFGVNEKSGWAVDVVNAANTSPESDKESELNITFKKYFQSVEAANDEMNSAIDTVFKITSTFNKENGWFYTYIDYRDTYRPLNFFDAVKQEDYFTREDYAFIERLPAEGEPIGKADSLYLARLNEKVFDLYGARTIFEEYFQHTAEAFRDSDVPGSWLDSLTRRKEELYERFAREGSLEEGEFLSPIDEMKIPLTPATRESIQRKALELQKQLDFISEAYSGKYTHSIKIPWMIVESNADSVSNNVLFWKPPVIKFLLGEYTMTVRSRKLNAWPTLISGIFVCLTIAVLLQRRKRSSFR